MVGDTIRDAAVTPQQLLELGKGDGGVSGADIIVREPESLLGACNVVLTGVVESVEPPGAMGSVEVALSVGTPGSVEVAVSVGVVGSVDVAV